jgi:DNA-binding NtrC family response regulator
MYNFHVPRTPISMIYVVDDEPIIASSCAKILNLSGFQATAFVNAESAIEGAKSGCPNLLIADINLPGMDGLELVLHFKSLCPGCKVLLVAGSPENKDLVEAAGLHFLLKPVQPRELLAAIAKL